MHAWAVYSLGAMCTCDTLFNALRGPARGVMRARIVQNIFRTQLAPIVVQAHNQQLPLA